MTDKTYGIELAMPDLPSFSFIHLSVNGDSIEEIEHRMSEDLARLANVANQAFAEASAITALHQGGLNPELVGQNETPPPAPAKPWEKKAAPAAPAADKPWMKGKAGAQPAIAPTSGNTFRVKFPYENDADKAKERKEFLQSFYVEFKNSLSFDKDEKLYKFNKQPGQAERDLLDQALAYFDGEIVSE